MIITMITAATAIGIFGYSKYKESIENYEQQLRENDVKVRGKRFFFTKAYPKYDKV